MPEHQPISTYPFAMNSALFIGAIWYTFYGSRFSFSSLIVITFAMQALIMLLIPFVASVGGTSAYWLCFALLFTFGLFSGVCQTACYGYNAKLPSSYISVFLISHGLAGIFSNVLRLTSLSLWPIEDDVEVGVTTAGADFSSNAFKACLFIQCSGVAVVLLCLPA